MRYAFAFLFVAALIMGCTSETPDAAPADKPVAASEGKAATSVAPATIPAKPGGGEWAFKTPEKPVPLTASGRDTCQLQMSIYLSWSAIYAAADVGYIDARAGHLGPIETIFGQDIEVVEGDYVKTLEAFGTGSPCGVTMTNMDALSVVPGRAAVFVFPTSTSAGADGVNADASIKTIQDLKGVPVYGERNSVNHYTFIRGLLHAGEDPAEYNFQHMTYDAVMTQLTQNNIKAGVQWNPERRVTLKLRNEGRPQPTLRSLFTSADFAGEIIDGSAVGADVYKTQRGQRFANVLVAISLQIGADVKAGDKKVLAAIRDRFNEEISDEDLPSYFKETRFYLTADEAIALFEGSEFREKVMPTVVKVTGIMGAIDAANPPSIKFGGGASDAKLIFATEPLKRLRK